jgi:hypothetical protein
MSIKVKNNIHWVGKIDWELSFTVMSIPLIGGRRIIHI